MWVVAPVRRHLPRHRLRRVVRLGMGRRNVSNRRIMALLVSIVTFIAFTSTADLQELALFVIGHFRNVKLFILLTFSIFLLFSFSLFFFLFIIICFFLFFIPSHDSNMHQFLLTLPHITRNDPHHTLHHQLLMHCYILIHLTFVPINKTNELINLHTA